MASRRRPLRTAAVVGGLFVLGPAATVLACLTSITSFAAYMDVHGVIVAMRVAVVAAVAVVVIPLAWGIGAARCERIARKAHLAQLAALNALRHAAAIAPANLVAELHALDDVRVTVDHDFGSGAVCQHCGHAPAVVRVYGEPASRHMFPLELAEVCVADALDAARQALGEQDEYSRSPIRIEVAA